MVFEHKPRDVPGAQAPDWRLHQRNAPDDDVEYVATMPQDAPSTWRAPGPPATQPYGPHQGIPAQQPYAPHQGIPAQQPYGPHPGFSAQQPFPPGSGPWPASPPLGFAPIAEPETIRRGSLALKIISWMVLAVLSLFTVAVAIGLTTGVSQDYVSHEVVVGSSEDDIGCNLTVQTDAGESAVVETLDDCVDAPQIGERITAYLPIDSEGSIVDGSDDFTFGYLPGEQPVTYMWVGVAFMAIGWLAFGIASIRYLWINRTR